MKGHQQHIILIRINRIDISHQRDLLKKSRKCSRLSYLLHGFLKRFCLGNQLIDIFYPCLSLFCFLSFKLLHITGKLNDFFQSFTDCISLRLALKSLDKGNKIVDLGSSAANGRHFLNHSERIIEA